MNLKDIRNRINKKIDERYKERQKILTKIKDYLNIDFNKISTYKSEINIKNYKTTTYNNDQKENTAAADYILFKVEIPSSIVANSRFFYKGIDLGSLTIEDAKNLEKDLEYILTQLEKEMDSMI